MSPVEVGARLKHHREGKGMDQEELAFKGGVSAKTVSNIECGRHSPRIETLIRLADAMGISVSELLAARSRLAAAA